MPYQNWLLKVVLYSRKSRRWKTTHERWSTVVAENGIVQEVLQLYRVPELGRAKDCRWKDMSGKKWRMRELLPENRVWWLNLSWFFSVIGSSQGSNRKYEKCGRKQGNTHSIVPRSISKERLYGTFDPDGHLIPTFFILLSDVPQKVAASCTLSYKKETVD
jgi:hypothetical protein